MLEGAAAAIVYMAMADGEVGDAELAEASDAIHNHPGLSDLLRPAQIDEVMERRLGHGRRKMMGELALKREVEQVKGRTSTEEREMILALAANIAVSDGEMREAERRALGEIGAMLGVPARDYL